MSCYLCRFLALWALLWPVAPGWAQESIRFARSPDISPDGKLVAFSYLGDIWVVEATGGRARHLTMHLKHDLGPLFSPDGKHLAFSSNRHGSYDVFVVPVQGGRPTRLTYDSADDFATGWSPDGKRVLFSSGRSSDFPFSYELFTVSAKGGRAVRLSVNEGREGAYSPNGQEIAYVRGPGTWYRKGYRGSSNDDIWICQADGRNNRRFTQFNGQDNSPIWSSDGRYLYYVSEYFGTPANLVRQEVNPQNEPAAPQPITCHKDEAVRKARLSGNGEWLIYECGADLWLLATRTGEARKLVIEINADDKANPERVASFSSGATEFAVSPDDKHVALVVHGEIFLMPRQGGKAKRLTDSPAFDHSISWSPDGKKLLFLSDRSGHEDIYLLEADDPDHPELTKAHRFKVKALTSTPDAEIGPGFSPDGKKISFLRNGRLFTMNPDGNGLKAVVDQGQVIDYEWSPDGHWFCYARMDPFFASELYIIPSAGATAADPPRNITRFATFNAGVTWSRNGMKLAFRSQRRQGLTGLYVMSLQKPAVANSPPSQEIDWEDLHLRVGQPTQAAVSEAAISPDGSRVAFRASQDGDDLWVANADGSKVTRLTTGNTSPRQLQWSRVVPSLLYFLDGNGTIRSVTVGGPGPAPGTNVIPFTARMTIHQEEEFREMFEQGWRFLHESFYDANFHGANWNVVRNKYRPLVKHCALREDLYALVSLMLGELNASHLGISGFISSPEQTTADLGLIFDPSHRGPGLKVAEILKRGPADRRGLNLGAGDIILAIDNVELTEQVDLARLLNDKAGDAVTVQVAAKLADPKARRRLELQAVSRPQVSSLMYERWVARNARRVAELSKGRLGYIHIPSMDEAGLDRFLRALYSDNYDKDAIVIDVRFNGGGFTHDRVLNYLGGKEHTFFRHRYGGQGLVLRSDDRKWFKPMVVLINNRSFSDAEIFPHAFRTLGLGKLVGQPTGGLVIGTRNLKLIDGSTFRVPLIGVSTVGGVNMEKEGVVPDVMVENHPDEVGRGEDQQLGKAVAVLQQEVANGKKPRSPIAVETRPANPTVAPKDDPRK